MPLGIPNARFFADGDPALMIEEGMRALEREVADARGPRARRRRRPNLPPVNFLAVSGGGDNGAFGAGLMNGWTEAGTRPEFKMVTGVSTGALIAPFAFLGPDYDAALREVYTTMTPDRVFRARGICAAAVRRRHGRHRRRSPRSSPSTPTRRCSTPSRANTAKAACC